MTIATTTTCPRCGADADAGGSSCGECGFEFVGGSGRPARPRRGSSAAVAVAAAAGVGIAVVALAALVVNDIGPTSPAPLAPDRAEARLARHLGLAADGSQGAVRCPETLEPGRLTRCGVIYPNGDTQLLPVRLTVDGELNTEVPYPAQRRPGLRHGRAPAAG